MGLVASLMRSGPNPSASGNRVQGAGSQNASKNVIGDRPVLNRLRAGTSKDIDVATQVAALLELLQEAGYPDGYQLCFKELNKVYREMCHQNTWRARGWVRIGRAFDVLTTNGEKPYANFYDDSGRVSRLRVYPIPSKPA